MKQLVKISNSELSYRLKLNYNNVYSRLKMLLGRKASLFADIMTKSTGTTWYSDDDAEYTRFSDAPKGEQATITKSLNDAVASVRKELSSSPELLEYVDDILEIPDNSFVFYRSTADGYKCILAGWGCKFAHQNSTDPNSGFIKRLSKNLEMPDTPTAASKKKEALSDTLGAMNLNDDQHAPDFDENTNQASTATTGSYEDIPKKTERPEVKPENDAKSENKVESDKKVEEPEFEKKTQHVVLRVLNQNNSPIAGEIVSVRTTSGETTRITTDDGTVEIGNLPYSDAFSITFPNIPGNHERSYEVEPGVETYDAFVKKLVKYSPVLFVEDQNGYAVQDYKIKIIIGGQDSIYDTGNNGVIQLPTMQEGQKFVAIDTANYANVKEYNITHDEAKTPYHFHIKRAEKAKVGITVLDKTGSPLPKVVVGLSIGDTPCQQVTGEDGRTEFPHEIFVAGNIPVDLHVKGKGQIKSSLKFTSDVTEYTIQLRDRSKGLGFNWKWLALIPLVLLLGWGGYRLYNMQWGTPTIKEMETGVVLIYSQVSYYVDFGIGDDVKYTDGTPLRYYFTYGQNSRKYDNFTHDPLKRAWDTGTGTGFLISKDGLIATNRHIADPIPPKEAIKMVKAQILKDKLRFQQSSDSLNDVLRTIGPLRLMNEQAALNYDKTLKEQEYVQEQISILEKVLNLGEFNLEVECRTSVAFINSIIESSEDFIGCSLRASGEPGGTTEKDVAIIQLKNKNRDIPQGAYIFKVPEKDLLDEEIPDDYDVTVLGYNAGIMLADIQNGIHPQSQPGKITIKNEQYRIGYNASTLGGSSGSPVFNKKGQLVAVNNSGFADAQGFNYGVRTKYLKELLDGIVKKDNKTTK